MIERADLPRFALSIRQPWAWAIMSGGKDLENRTQMAVRHMLARARPGVMLAIHASQTMSRREYESARDFMLSRKLVDEVPRPHELVRGAIIGCVRFDEVVKDSASLWWMGPRALRLSSPQLCEPIGCSGALGFFDWRDGVEWQGGEPLTEVAKPLPWMGAWPGRYHPFTKAPDKIIPAPERAPSLFEDR